MKNTKSDQQVIRSAGSMSIGTMGSRLLGLARDMLLLAFFSRTVTDAFVVAFRLPNLFRRLLGEGSLSVSFIPVFVEVKTKHGEESAQNLASSIMTLLLITTSILSILGVIWMEPLLTSLVGGEGFLKVPGKLEQTIFLARIMFSYLFLVTVYAYFMAILNALKYFLIPALAPALFNFILIVFILLPQSGSQVPGEMLSWGVIAGGVFQALLVAYKLYQLKYLPRLSLQWTPYVKKILFNMIPGAIGLGILQLMSLVNVHYASQLAEGSHSYIYSGDRILELPQSLLAVSLGAALLPTLSSLWAQNLQEEMIQAGQRHLRLILFLSIPSAIGLFVLSDPIVKVLFMRGGFGAKDAEVTSVVVQLYSFLLVASSFTKVLVPSFYAIKNTWTPALVSAFTLLFHVLLAPILMRQHGLYGLVASTVISGFFNMILLLISYHIFIGRFPLKAFVRGLFPMLPPSFFLAVSVFFLYQWSHALFLMVLPLSVARVLSLFLSIGTGVGVYFYVSNKLKIYEAQAFISLMKRKMKSAK